MTLAELFNRIAELPKIDYWNEFNREDLLKENKNFFRKMIQHRIDHCEKQVIENLDRAKSLGPLVVWKGGHFSISVYAELSRFVDTDITEWSALVWEQIIRQMGREQEHFDPILWDIASEMLLVSNR